MKIPLLSKKNPFAPRTYGELHKVTPNVYIFRNITNSSFVVGDKGVCVIDTQVNLPSAERVLSLIRTVTDKPITHVINTHYHWDHTNGNALFKKEGAVVISSKRTQEYMDIRAPRQKAFLASRGFELGDDPLMPEITFEGSYEIDLGNMPLKLFYAGSAESDDATAIEVVREGVIMSGDTVMTGSFPIFGQPVWDEGLESDEWIQTIGNLMARKPKTIVPGHGDLAGEKEVKLLIQIQEYFLKEVRDRIQKGFNLKQILDDLEPKFPSWISKIPEVWGTPRYAILRVYRGLTKKANDTPGWQQYKPLAIPYSEKKVTSKNTHTEYLKMAREAKEGGDAGLRLAILKEASEKFSNEFEAHLEFAEALIEESRQVESVLEKGDFFDLAKSLWDRVLAENPLNVRALLGKGRYWVMLAYRGGDNPKAGMNLLNRALEISQNPIEKSEAHFYLGMGHRRLGDEVTAKIHYEESLKLNPLFMPARLAQQAS